VPVNGSDDSLPSNSISSPSFTGLSAPALAIGTFSLLMVPFSLNEEVPPILKIASPAKYVVSISEISTCSLSSHILIITAFPGVYPLISGGVASFFDVTIQR